MKIVPPNEERYNIIATQAYSGSYKLPSFSQLNGLNGISWDLTRFWGIGFKRACSRKQRVPGFRALCQNVLAGSVNFVGVHESRII